MATESLSQVSTPAGSEDGDALQAATLYDTFLLEMKFFLLCAVLFTAESNKVSRSLRSTALRLDATVATEESEEKNPCPDDLDNHYPDSLDPKYTIVGKNKLDSIWDVDKLREALSKEERWVIGEPWLLKATFTNNGNVPRMFGFQAGQDKGFMNILVPAGCVECTLSSSGPVLTSAQHAEYLYRDEKPFTSGEVTMSNICLTPQVCKNFECPHPQTQKLKPESFGFSEAACCEPRKCSDEVTCAPTTQWEPRKDFDTRLGSTPQGCCVAKYCPADLCDNITGWDKNPATGLKGHGRLAATITNITVKGWGDIECCEEKKCSEFEIQPELKSHWKLKEIGKADPKRDPTTYSRIGAAKTTRRVMRKAPDWAVELSKEIKCPDCEEAKKPRPAPPSSTKDLPGLFEMVGTDVFEVEFHDDEKDITMKGKYILWRDRASGLAQVDMLQEFAGETGIDRWEPKTADVLRSFGKWLMNNPAPRWVISDPATYYTSSDFIDFMARSGIGILTSPAEAHWVMGAEEGCIGILKNTFRRMKKECPELGLEETMCLCVHGHNQTIGPSGFSPFQWTRGADAPEPSLPAGIRPREAFDHMLRLKAKAKVAYEMEYARSRMSRLNNAVGRPTNLYKGGDLVMVWRQQGGKGRWVGPLRALIQEGTTVWLATGSAIVKAKVNQCRPVTRREELQANLEGTAVMKTPGKVSDLEKQWANALEVAKAAEAAAKNASTMVAAQESQLRVMRSPSGDWCVTSGRVWLASCVGALDAANLTKAELAGIILKEAHLGTKQENVDRVVKDIESKLVEFATAAEKEADEAEDDAVKAKNTSDILKARQANMRYEVDDLSNSMEVLFKEQNITRKAEQLLLLKALGLGKSINQIDGSMKLVNGSISSIIRQALESLKLAKQAKEEADDALDDHCLAGTSGFSGGYTKTASAQARSAKEAGSKSSSSSKPVVVSSSFDVNNAAAAAKQRAKAAWEAVKQMQVLNAMPRPIYEVASMTGDMIEIMKGPQGPPGKAGPDGLDGPRGKTGPPGKDAKPVDIENLTQMEVAGETTAEPTVADDDLVGAEEVAASNSTAALHTSPPPTRKGAGFGLYLVAFGANVVALFILYRWINAILNTGCNPSFILQAEL
eukprot:g32534.t2